MTIPLKEEELRVSMKTGRKKRNRLQKKKQSDKLHNEAKKRDYKAKMRMNGSLINSDQKNKEESKSSTEANGQYTLTIPSTPDRGNH